MPAAVSSQVAESWELNNNDLELLSWAARICQIGLDISHTQYHMHGAYLIDHSDLMGFSKRQQQQLAALVGGHRRSLPRSVAGGWPRDESRRLTRLIILLRIANVLSHGRDDESLPEYILKVSASKVNLYFPQGWIDQHLLTAADFASECGYLHRAGYKLTVC